MRFEPFFRWYDLWIGMYVDTKGKSIYLCPIPMVGIKMTWKETKMQVPNWLQDFIDWLRGLVKTTTGSTTTQPPWVTPTTQPPWVTPTTQPPPVSPTTTTSPPWVPPTTVPPMESTTPEPWVTVSPTTNPPFTTETPSFNFAQQLLEAHNRYREEESRRDSQFRSPLTIHSLLTQAAQKHNDWMTQNHLLDHKQGEVTPGQRVTTAGYKWSWVGENISEGYRTPERVMEAWMSSTDHRQNILRPQFREVGFGFGKASNGRSYWTAVFASPGSRDFEGNEETFVFLSGPLKGQDEPDNSEKSGQSPTF